MCVCICAHIFNPFKFIISNSCIKSYYIHVEVKQEKMLEKR